MRSNIFNLLGYEFDLPQLINRKNAVSWFEIPVLNVERAVNFYSRVFSVKIREENGMYFFPMNKFADGASGSLVQVKDNKPAKVGTLIYFYTVLDTEGNRIGIHMER
jgi:predicted enzyme related to lactoylglutathione lyase